MVHSRGKRGQISVLPLHLYRGSRYPDNDILFLGDYDLTPFGPWYGDVESSIEQTISSINMLQQIPASTLYVY